MTGHVYAVIGDNLPEPHTLIECPCGWKLRIPGNDQPARRKAAWAGASHRRNPVSMPATATERATEAIPGPE